MSSAKEEAPRRRLSREDRQEQLLAIGVAMAEQSSFDAINLDEVARRAGISRTLLFHYFPTRREYMIALAEVAAQELIEATEPDRELPEDDQLRDSLERFVDYVAVRREAYLSLVRGAASGDPGMQAVFDRTRAKMVERMFDEGSPYALPSNDSMSFARVSGRGYLGFIEEATCAWLRDPVISRDALVELFVRCALGIFAATQSAMPVDTE